MVSAKGLRLFGTGFLAAAVLAAGLFFWDRSIQRDESRQTAAARLTVGEQLVIPVAARSPALPFRVQTVEFSGGGWFDLEAARGDVVVMFFMAAWCPTCLPEAKALARIQQRYGDRGVSVLVLDVDLRETEFELQGFSDQVGPNELTWAFDAESRIIRAYEVTGLDATVIIDREGYIAYVDAYPTPLEVLESLIAAVL